MDIADSFYNKVRGLHSIESVLVNGKYKLVNLVNELVIFYYKLVSYPIRMCIQILYSESLYLLKILIESECKILNVKAKM